MANRLISFPAQANDTEGLPLSTQVSEYRVYDNGAQVATVSPPSTQVTLNLAPGAHSFEVSGFNGVEGPKGAATAYVEPSNVPGPVEPVSVS